MKNIFIKMKNIFNVHIKYNFIEFITFLLSVFITFPSVFFLIYNLLSVFITFPSVFF